VNAMTVVAMSFQETQWTAMCRGELRDKEKRMLFAAISAATLDKCLELEGKQQDRSQKQGLAWCLLVLDSKHSGRNGKLRIGRMMWILLK